MSFISNSDFSRGSKAIRDYAFTMNNNRRFFDFFDPFFWLVLLLFYPILKSNLDQKEAHIIEMNINKHRHVMWVSFICSVLFWFGLTTINDTSLYQTLIIAFLAPLIVTGGAWYTITFGGVPESSIKAAVGLTKWIFTAFSVSLISTLITLSFIFPWQITFIFSFIVFLVLWTAITFDNVDSLKIGLDDSLRKQSLTTLASLAKKGIYPIESDEELNDLITKCKNKE